MEQSERFEFVAAASKSVENNYFGFTEKFSIDLIRKTTILKYPGRPKAKLNIQKSYMWKCMHNEGFWIEILLECGANGENILAN